MDLTKIVGVLLPERLKLLLTIPDKIHLVDQHRHLLHPEHRDHVAMPFRVLADAFVRVDHEQCGLGT